MIVLISDIHGDPEILNTIIQTEKMNKDDVLIVCGDFGLVFNGSKRENNALDKLDTLGTTICYVDGNHESFELLKSYPCEKWNGGTVHRIRENILHMMRGQVYNIESKKIFTMGGASSEDKQIRIPGKNWWREEIPSVRECDEAVKNLKNNGCRVDYIITHQAPCKVVHEMGGRIQPEEVGFTGFLDLLTENVRFEKWYFGHWHTDISDVLEKYNGVYRRPVIIR